MKLTLCFAFAFLSIPLWAQDRLDSLTKRIEELEKQQEEFLLQSSERDTSQVSSFLNSKITFGGFFEPSYTLLSGPDTEFQATSSSNILGLNIAADYTDNIKFVSQFITGLVLPLQNEHNNPGAAGGQPEKREFGSYTTGTLLTQGYLEYSFNSNYRLQGGMGYVPFGHAFQQRELVLFIRRGGPQVLRTNELVSPLWSGLNLSASFPLTNSTWGYNVYTFSPVTSPRHPGLGGRIFWGSAEDKFNTGLSTQVGKIGANNFETVGADFRFNFSPFLVTTEFIESFYEDQDAWSAYVEPGIYILDEEVLLYAFGDYQYGSRARNGGTGATSFRDPIQKYEYGFGVNWLPTSFTRIRAGLTFHDYVGKDAIITGQNRDYTSLDLSAGVAF